MKASRNVTVEINKEFISREAEQLFTKMGGFDREGKKFDTLRDKSREMRREIEERIDGRAVFSCYNDVVFNGREATVGGVVLKCSAFEQIDPKSVKSAIVYFVNAGDYYLEDQPIMNQLLADMWGTAFTDAVREYFEKQLMSETRLSDGFGPGFYGMDVRQMGDLAKLADPSLIDIELRESSVLLPLKSCAGIFFEVDDSYQRIDDECLDCRGTMSSCNYCNVKRKKKMFKCTGICSQCGRCKNSGMIAGANDRKTKMIVLPDDFVPEKDEQGYGIAYDIGTTTVVGMMWDIMNGVLVDAEARTNPQNEFGLDVISRITFAGQAKGNLEILNSKIVECLNEITETLCKKNEINREAVVRATVCGNTTMSHLFAKHDPSSLAHAPFDPDYTGTLFFKAEEAGLNIKSGSAVMLLPNIAGHVGGDITAGILATRLLERKETLIFIDIGTNGEIVFTRNGRAYTCSTAAGPAFEGASIYQGMRAATGAIEKIRIENDDVLFKVIGEVPPTGICGSGLIDAVAEMLKAGIINKTGRIVAAEDYRKKHQDAFMAERIREGGSGREFVLVSRENGEDIVISQNDIREVQLAKAAIAAGMTLMMRKADCTFDDIDNIIVAGAFGNYINKDSAAAIGLLPDIGSRRIISAGNTAGIGCLMAAASAKEALYAQNIPDRVEHVELAEEKDFQNVYLSAMAFKV